ncbi:hypothetical protein [Micromonospora sp. KC606]|nr:hypothetical protein [Micromonospora sp. KC606]
MTLDQSALLEVLDALKAAEVNDRVRQASETIHQAWCHTGAIISQAVAR